MCSIRARHTGDEGCRGLTGGDLGELSAIGRRSPTIRPSCNSGSVRLSSPSSLSSLLLQTADSAGSRQQAADSRQQAANGRRQAAGNPVSLSTISYRQSDVVSAVSRQPSGRMLAVATTKNEMFAVGYKTSVDQSSSSVSSNQSWVVIYQSSPAVNGQSAVTSQPIMQCRRVRL